MQKSNLLYQIIKVSYYIIIVCFISITVLLFAAVFYDSENSFFSFENVYKTLTLLLTAFTVGLLYVNYKLQQRELKKMTDANDAMVEANKDIVKANESIVQQNKEANQIQIILSEKIKIAEYFDADIKKTINKLNTIFAGYMYILSSDPADKSNKLQKEQNVILTLNEDHLNIFFKTCSKLDNQILLLKKVGIEKPTLNILIASFPNEFDQLFKNIFQYLNINVMIEVFNERLEDDPYKIETIHKLKNMYLPILNYKRIYSIIREL
ncbi:hypothetical protein QYS48_16960 [Marivirga arenosa]|uniref:Uncharacterized protein n=1 Tax=Marivirga arenosa TaxID=3059076 RepID=A0AA49GF91_9BACT|nr:hypothetical protein [Marivirga sp. ABR2-2]WKK83930.2 hypothetical protein QYS48_16960 [Marivirga sp. ABR2-2]